MYDFVRKGVCFIVGMKVERFGGDLVKVGVSFVCIIIEDFVKGWIWWGSGEFVLWFVSKFI